MTDVATTGDEDRDEVLFRERLAGLSERNIAKRHGITTREVREAVLRLVPTVDHESRKRELQLELARIDRLYARFYAQALNGDAPSALIAIRLGERRSLLWGMDNAPVKSMLPTIALLQPESRRNSTERIRQVLHELRQQRVVAGPVDLTRPLPPPDTGIAPESGADRDPDKVY